MKILISADMEGISGVVVWDQVTPEHSEYLQRFRSLMIGDVNAAIEGAFDGGATEVVVTDSHWYGLNLRLEDLDPRALLNSGLSSPLAMMQGSIGVSMGWCLSGAIRAAGRGMRH